MNVFGKSIVGRDNGLLRRKSALAVASSMALAGLLTSSSARAASANWNASATNGNWEAAGTENNWSTGAGTFPGNISSGSTTNTDSAVFGVVSNISNIAIN